MSEVQTNFRAQDMLGTAKPVVKAVAKPAKVAPKVEAVVEPVVVIEDVVEAPAVEETVDAPAAE
jgi:hypothetical protein